MRLVTMAISQWNLLAFVTRNSVGLIHVGVSCLRTQDWCHGHSLNGAESAPTRLAAHSEYKTPDDLLGQWLVGRCPREGGCSVPAGRLRGLGKPPDCRDSSGQGRNKEWACWQVSNSRVQLAKPQVGQKATGTGDEELAEVGLRTRWPQATPNPAV